MDRPPKMIDDGFGNQVRNQDYEIYMAGVEEVMEWIEKELINISEDWTGSSYLFLRLDGYKAARKWQAFREEKELP